MNRGIARAEACMGTRTVNAYADGELEPSRIVEFEQHMGGCTSCRDEFELVNTLRRSLRRSTVRTPSSAFAERMRLVVANESVRQADANESIDRASAVPPQAVAAHFGGAQRAAEKDTSTRGRWRGRLSWAATVTAAAAAGFVCSFVGSRSDLARNNGKAVALLDKDLAPPAPSPSGFFERRASGFDAVIDPLVSFHANPPPPEVVDLDQAMHRFEPLVGVHMPGTTLRRPLGASFSGARIYDMDVRPVTDAHYTAALRYTMQGHRITVYIFNPSVVPIQMTRLKPRVVVAMSKPTLPSGSASPTVEHDVPVYVGRVRGFSVAAAEQSGIGYAVASDLDDDQSAELVANFQ